MEYNPAVKDAETLQETANVSAPYRHLPDNTHFGWTIADAFALGGHSRETGLPLCARAVVEGGDNDVGGGMMSPLGRLQGVLFTMIQQVVLLMTSLCRPILVRMSASS